MKKKQQNNYKKSQNEEKKLKKHLVKARQKNVETTFSLRKYQEKIRFIFNIVKEKQEAACSSLHI